MGEGFSAETLFPIYGPLIFEVYNGHPVVRIAGDEDLRMVSNERSWDIVLSMRLRRGKENILLGIGAEGSHSYYKKGPQEANPGRGRTVGFDVGIDSTGARAQMGARMSTVFFVEIFSAMSVALRSLSCQSCRSC